MNNDGNTTRYNTIAYTVEYLNAAWVRYNEIPPHWTRSRSTLMRFIETAVTEYECKSGI